MSSSYALTSLVGRLPWFAVAMVAIIVAISRWQRHPTVSMLVTIGVIIQVLTSLSSLVTTPLLAGGSTEQRSLAVALMSGVSLVSTVGYGLVIAAVFSGRATGAEPPAQRW